MSVTITDIAREKLKEAMKGAEFKNPALKIIFSGFG